MNKLYSVLLLLLLSSFSYSQTADTIWYNNKWVKTNIKAEHYYFSVVNFDSNKNLYHVQDYYPDGKIQMSGEYSSLDPKVKNGAFTWYQANGLKKLYTFYQYDSTCITETYDASGKRIETIYRREYISTLSNSQKDSLGLPIQIDEPAEFPGGDEKLQEFISQNTHYPKNAVKNNVEGTIYVVFKISKSGKVKDVSTHGNKDPLLIEEAKRMVLSMPRWKPGKDKGKIVEDTKALPIVFHLRDN